MSIEFFSAIGFPKFSGKGNPSCSEVDPEIFFPEMGRTFNNNAAKQICNSCVYKPECLEWAMNSSEDGIWGGTTERERRALKRHRRYAQMKSTSRVARLGYDSSEDRVAG